MISALPCIILYFDKEFLNIHDYFIRKIPKYEFSLLRQFVSSWQMALLWVGLNGVPPKC